MNYYTEFCPLGCGELESESKHFAHEGVACSYHAGTCEEAEKDSFLWCPCGREEVKVNG